jgi:hypothetical protein
LKSLSEISSTSLSLKSIIMLSLRIWRNPAALFFHVSCVCGLRFAYLWKLSHPYSFSWIFFHVQAGLGSGRIEVQFLTIWLVL